MSQNELKLGQIVVVLVTAALVEKVLPLARCAALTASIVHNPDFFRERCGITTRNFSGLRHRFRRLRSCGCGAGRRRRHRGETHDLLQIFTLVPALLEMWKILIFFN